MKSKEQALLEWVSDEIKFDDTHLSGKLLFTREEFAGLCKLMRGRSGASVPVLQEAIDNLKNVMRRASWNPDNTEAWLDGFFAPENLVRFIDAYEIKRKLTKKDENLHKLLDESLFNVMK